MLRKFTLMAGMAMALSACSALTPATDSHYVSADGRMSIRGELVDSTDVRIFVNDNKVIDQRVSLLRGDGEFAGDYEGKPVNVNCSTESGRKLHATTCTVSVAGEKIRLTL